MPVRAKAKSRAPRRKAGRVYRKKARITKSLMPVHNFTRDVQFPILNPSLVDPYFERFFWTLGALSTGAGSLPSAVTDFTNLFDEYKINSVTVIFRLEVDPGAQTGPVAVYPRLTTWKDYNDTAVPASIDEVRTRQAKQISTLYPGKNIYRKVRPALQTAILKSPSGVTVNAPKWNTWLPCAITDVEHLGMKYCIERWNNVNYTINVLFRYHISCRHVR